MYIQQTLVGLVRASLCGHGSVFSVSAGRGVKAKLLETCSEILHEEYQQRVTMKIWMKGFCRDAEGILHTIFHRDLHTGNLQNLPRCLLVVFFAKLFGLLLG